MERYSVVIVRSILGGGKGTGSVLSGGYFEDYCDGKLEGVRPGECDPLGVSYGNEVGTIKGTDGEVLVTALEAAYRSKLGGDKNSGLVSSYGSFGGPNNDNLEGLVPGDGDPLGIVEGTGYGKILSKLDGVVCD